MMLQTASQYSRPAAKRRAYRETREKIEESFIRQRDRQSVATELAEQTTETPNEKAWQAVVPLPACQIALPT